MNFLGDQGDDASIRKAEIQERGHFTGWEVVVQVGYDGLCNMGPIAAFGVGRPFQPMNHETIVFAPVDEKAEPFHDRPP